MSSRSPGADGRSPADFPQPPVGPSTCPDRQILAAFERGELSADASEPVAAHVESCTACQAALGGLTGTPDALLDGLRHVRQAVAAQGEPTLLTGPPVSALAPAPPGYELLERVGQGGMGVVHRARDVRLGREVAVKLLRDDYPAGSAVCARFVAEAQITGQLQHPGIPAVHELGTLPDGRPFLAMKLVKGRTLHELLKERADPAQGRGRFVAVFEQVCQAVGYAHAHRVIHRDLKPGNVMVGAFGEVQVMDWGLAKVLAATAPAVADNEAGPPETMMALTAIDTPLAGESGTRTGAVMGTPAYMAPEQAGGEVRKLGARSDVFGLGAILCQILTGQPPFSGKDANEVRLQAVRGELQGAFARLDACGAEPDLIALCKKCLAFRQADRPADGEAVAHEVARIRTAAEERARQAERERAAALAREAEQRKRRRQLLAAAVAIAAVLTVGIVGTAVGLVRASRAAEAERQANGQAQKRLNQIEKGNEVLTAIFKDLDVRKIKEGTEPLEAVLAKRLVKAAEQLEGEEVGDPLAVAQLQNELGVALLHLGYPNEAVPPLEKARATLSDHQGADHPDTLTSVNNLAGAYQAAGQFDKALPLYEEALRRRKAALGDDHADTLSSMNNLAACYEVAGQFDKGLPLLEETLRRRKAALGDDHPDTLTTMNNLAHAYQDAGDLAKARALFEETLRLQKAKRGPDHPDTLNTMNNLGAVYLLLGQLDEAVPLQEEALRLCKARLGTEHLQTLKGMNNLASAYKAGGQPGKALPLYEEALRLYRERLGPDHRDTLTLMHNLAGSYEATGQLGKALALYEETLRQKQAKLGADDLDTLKTMIGLAAAYQAAGKADKAPPLLEEARRGFQAKLGAEHPYTLLSLGNLAIAYCDAKHGDKAVPLFAEYFERRRKRSKPNDPVLAASLAVAGDKLLSCDRSTEAEAYLRECLSIRESAQPDAWTTFNADALLGGALLGQKKYAEAEPLLLKGYEGMKQRESQIPKEAKGNLAEAAERLVALYDAWGKPAEAAKWRQELAAGKGAEGKSKD
jgi:serine/threonine protein kinase